MDDMVTAVANSPWHPGEVEMQQAVGVADRMLDVGRRVIRDYMPDQHRAFFAQMPFLVIGTVDRDGDPWASLVAGRPGFASSPTNKTLSVRAKPDPHDPASDGLARGGGMGILAIEPPTRRRNRLNGVLKEASSDGFFMDVVQSFGNCPQYIQARDFEFVREPNTFSESAVEETAALTARDKALIASADTLFVASYVDGDHGVRQVDVSHRGGKAGFVRISDDGVLTIPDFAGNLFFATLGNFLINPRAGIVFVDFETGDLLQMTGAARVDLTSPEIAAFQGAERLWHFTPRRVLFRKGALPLRWAFQSNGWSPNSLMTGSWQEAESRLKAAALATAWRPLRIKKIVDESTLIRSFLLEPTDGAGLIPSLAGQHLPIRVTLPKCEKPAIRTYTLSSGPADGIYRISVKNQGLVSRFLHETLRVGDILEARAPAGQFTIDASERRPAVLLAAGVGVTPMLAMLRHTVYEGHRTRRIRPTWFFLSARSKREQAFAKEIAQIEGSARGAVHLMRLLSDPTGAEEERDFDEIGRIDIDLLCRVLPFNDYDFYMCGPSAFMQSMYDSLRDLSVADARIHAEAFGPSSLKRRPDGTADATPARPASTVPVPVMFVKSGKEARWNPGDGSLLELAESRGLSPEFGCRGGSCGTCRVRIVEGTVTYTLQPDFKVGDSEALICCAVPAGADNPENNRLFLDV